MSARGYQASAGCRDRQVTIQQRPVADATATSGFPKDDWTTLATAFMEKIDVSGSEAFRAQQLAAKYDTRWKMPYRADMDPDLLDVPKLRRLLFQGRTFDIVAATQIGRKRGIELTTLASTRVDA